MTQTQTATHTPGPWTMYRTPDYFGVRNENEVIATIKPWDTIPSSEAEANAALIASAPKLAADNAALLAALKGIVDTYRTFRNVPQEDQMWTSIDDDALEAGFAAIAQAEVQ